MLHCNIQKPPLPSYTTFCSVHGCQITTILHMVASDVPNWRTVLLATERRLSRTAGGEYLYQLRSRCSGTRLNLLPRGEPRNLSEQTPHKSTSCYHARILSLRERKSTSSTGNSEACTPRKSPPNARHAATARDHEQSNGAYQTQT